MSARTLTPWFVVCVIRVVITFGDGSPIAWNFVMAFNLFRWVCMGEDQQMLQKKIKWYILGTLVFSLGLAFLALGCTSSPSLPPVQVSHWILSLLSILFCFFGS